MNLFTIVLTSAAVSAAVGGSFVLFGQYFERRANRKELLFKTSFELAKTKTDFLIELAKNTGSVPSIHDYVAYAEMYYWLLDKLYDDGFLPDNWRDEVARRFLLQPGQSQRS